uniref:Uncharacterized protein n=1 Tax=Myotis myotis TaxID=51298 RepID=A0A7J7RLT3_MYOMY|nr:hypothetical protein mMyoMyo1_010283 [Myotis myotis]
MGKAGAIHPALGTEPPRPAPKWRLRGGRDRVCVNVTLGRGISSPKPGPGPSSRREGGREGGGGAAAGFRVGLGLGCEHKLRRRPRGERGRRAARPAAVPGAARGAARAAGGGGRRREAACAQQEVRAMRFGAAPAPRRVPGGHGLPPLRPRRRGSRCFLTGVVRPRRLCWCLSPWDAPTRPGPRRPAAAEAPAFGLPGVTQWVRGECPGATAARWPRKRGVLRLRQEVGAERSPRAATVLESHRLSILPALPRAEGVLRTVAPKVTRAP